MVKVADDTVLVESEEWPDSADGMSKGEMELTLDKVSPVAVVTSCNEYCVTGRVKLGHQWSGQNGPPAKV